MIVRPRGRASLPPMLVETFPSGPLGCNCSILVDPATKAALVIDPGGDFEVIRGHLERTPLRHYPGLSALVGAEIWVKHENFLPTGAFKVYLTRTASVNTAGGKPQLSWKVTGRGSVPPQRMSEATPIFAEMATPGTSFTGSWREREALENHDAARALGWCCACS